MIIQRSNYMDMLNDLVQYPGYNQRNITQHVSSAMPGYGAALVTIPKTIPLDETPIRFEIFDLAPIETQDFSFNTVTSELSVITPMVMRLTVNLTLEFNTSEEFQMIISREEPAPYTYSTSSQGSGGNKPVSISLTSLHDVTSVGEKFWLTVNNAAGATSVDVTGGILIAEYIPRIDAEGTPNPGAKTPRF